VYLPQHFREDRVDVLHQAIRDLAFGIVVTCGKAGLIASHIPLFLDPEPSPLGTLRGHISRANPQSRDFSPEIPALAILSGPHHYIRPSWYPAKDEHGRVVPTWNYVAVHAYGTMRLFEQPEALLRNVKALLRNKNHARHQICCAKVASMGTSWKPSSRALPRSLASRCF
jgi:transcriptional regulator